MARAMDHADSRIGCSSLSLSRAIGNCREAGLLFFRQQNGLTAPSTTLIGNFRLGLNN